MRLRFLSQAEAKRSSELATLIKEGVAGGGWCALEAGPRGELTMQVGALKMVPIGVLFSLFG